jgi:hypothetical protein
MNDFVGRVIDDLDEDTLNRSLDLFKVSNSDLVSPIPFYNICEPRGKAIVMAH